MKKSILFFVIAIIAIGYCHKNVYAATYHVSKTGAKTSGFSIPDDWTNSNCYRSIGSALNEASSAGDEIIVNDGTYYDLENFINDREYSIPSGASSVKPTIIRARNRLSVRLRNTSTLNYYDCPIFLSGSYVSVDGFILDVVNSNDPASICYIGGTYNRVTNCIAIRRGVADNYSSWFSLMGSYNLVEDCAGAGHTRYGFESGSADGTTHHNVFRRCVGRADYSDSDQPMATFNFYGNSNGNYNAEYVAFQNCIAVDGHMMRTGNGTYAYAWGGFYFPHAVKDAILRGCIVLNVDCVHGAYCPKEESGYNITMTDCVAWDTENSWDSNRGYGLNLRGDGNGVTVDHCTFGASYRGIYNNSGSSSGNSITNTLFMQNTQIGTPGNWNTQNKNGFNPSAQAFGNNPVLSTDTLAYLCRIESGTAFDGAASDGGDIGATIEKKHGASGTFWGQTGWDTLTSDDLWPWANEDKIREVFREANNPNSGSTPSNNDTTRGFCADGQTLTKYILGYLGSEVPILFAPNSFRASSISYNQIQLEWLDTSDVEDGFCLERKEGIDGTYVPIDAAIPASAGSGNTVTYLDDLGLASNVTYYYRIRAYKDSNFSGYAETYATTGYTLDPPSNLTLTVVLSGDTETCVVLGWENTSIGADGFKIERKKGIAGVYEEKATVGKDDVIYADTSCASGNTYYYRLRAFNDKAYSNYSEEKLVSIASSSEDGDTSTGDGDADGTTSALSTHGSDRGCFIATAAYGTPLAVQVRALSEFRDNYLLKKTKGIIFVGFYEKYSPRIANYISKRDLAKQVTRVFLYPLVRIAQIYF